MAREDRLGCMYDWFASQKLPWPTQTCRWGPVLEKDASYTKQILYITEQTDGSSPNTILMLQVNVPELRTQDPIRMWSLLDGNDSRPIGKRVKTIRHDGEVNVLREFATHPHIVCTQTDAREVYVWDTETQSNMSKSDAGTSSNPNLVLSGHEGEAGFALSTSTIGTQVASGGKDGLALVWDLEDQQCIPRKENLPSSKHSTIVDARSTFKGHEGTVEGVSFHPTSQTEIASVGIDKKLILWDARLPSMVASRVEGAHLKDVGCVEWHWGLDFYVATGGADCLVKVWDRRMLRSGPGGCVLASREHKNAVTHLAWCPQDKRVLASGGEDGRVMLWNLSEVISPIVPGREENADPLMFEHREHVGQITDLGWNPHCPLTVVSSAAGYDRRGFSRCTLQSWRIVDFIYREKEAVLAELEVHRDFILSDGGEIDT